MDIMNIKGHPPWYARGTPVTNIRDGPAMAINHKLLFAICRGPSASEKPMGKTHRWLTLKTTFFNTQNSVFSQWYGLLNVDADRSRDAVRSGVADLSGILTLTGLTTLSGRGDGRLVSVRSS
jgi:hypothetical protein